MFLGNRLGPPGAVNNLIRLPSDLWNLPLRTLDISQNPCLGRVLLSLLAEAARCVTLQELRLRAIMGKGAACVGGLHL